VRDGKPGQSSGTAARVGLVLPRGHAIDGDPAAWDKSDAILLPRSLTDADGVAPLADLAPGLYRIGASAMRPSCSPTCAGPLRHG